MSKDYTNELNNGRLSEVDFIDKNAVGYEQIEGIDRKSCKLSPETWTAVINFYKGQNVPLEQGIAQGTTESAENDSLEAKLEEKVDLNNENLSSIYNAQSIGTDTDDYSRPIKTPEITIENSRYLSDTIVEAIKDQIKEQLMQREKKDEIDNQYSDNQYSNETDGSFNKTGSEGPSQIAVPAVGGAPYGNFPGDPDDSSSKDEYTNIYDPRLESNDIEVDVAKSKEIFTAPGETNNNIDDYNKFSSDNKVDIDEIQAKLGEALAKYGGHKYEDNEVKERDLGEALTVSENALDPIENDLTSSEEYNDNSIYNDYKIPDTSAYEVEEAAETYDNNEVPQEEKQWEIDTASAQVSEENIRDVKALLDESRQLEEEKAKYDNSLADLANQVQSSTEELESKKQALESLKDQVIEYLNQGRKTVEEKRAQSEEYRQTLEENSKESSRVIEDIEALKGIIK